MQTINFWFLDINSKLGSKLCVHDETIQLPLTVKCGYKTQPCEDT